jgi:hypothetical protein
MNTSYFLILGLFLSSLAYGADETDILFVREATDEQRQAVATQLEAVPENQTLTTMEAIAEVCYEMDLCGSLTPQSDLDLNCKGRDYSTEELRPDPSDQCYVDYFRKTHSCNKEISADSVKSVQKMSKFLDNNNSLYINLILDPMLQYLSKKDQVNYCEMKDDSKAMQEFLKKNPMKMKELMKVTKDSTALGQYTLDCYQKINPILFGKDQTELKRYYNLFSSVVSTMEMFPSYKGMVNRGTSLPEAVLAEHHKIGNVVCYSGFTSTAVHVAADLGDHPRNSFLAEKCAQRLYIKYEDNGAVPGKLIDSGSAAKGENEVLFEPGACFRIDKVTPRTDTPDAEDKATCTENQRFNFEMTLVPSQSK